MKKTLKILLHIARISFECGLCWEIYFEAGMWTCIFAILAFSVFERLIITFKLQQQINRENIDNFRILAKQKDGDAYNKKT